MLLGEWRLSWAVLFGKKGCLCCVQHRHKKDKFLGRAYPKGMGYWGGSRERVAWESLSLHMHTKFEFLASAVSEI